jgi:hypothetical protein
MPEHIRKTKIANDKVIIKLTEASWYLGLTYQTLAQFTNKQRFITQRSTKH